MIKYSLDVRMKSVAVLCLERIGTDCFFATNVIVLVWCRPIRQVFSLGAFMFALESTARSNAPERQVNERSLKVNETLGAHGELWIRPGVELQYLFFVLAAFAQLATVLITWPLWEVRDFPVNMPLGSGTTFPVGDWLQWDFAWLMVASLVVSIGLPKWGTLLHSAVLLIACVSDQFRQQPQFLFLATMLILLARRDGLLAARWLLIALWFWAGFHKLLSPEWLGYNASALLARQTWIDELSYPQFAYAVALGEMGVGIIAVFWRRVPAILALLMHLGIAVFLTPVGITHNYSVIPWNLFVGISAFYVLWTVKPQLPTRWRTQSFSLAMLLAPALFYLNMLDHGLSFVLYSGMVPYGRITTDAADPESDPIHGQIEGWGKLAVPFPNERRHLIQYFQLSAPVGSKLHLHDPRWGQKEQYFQKSENGLVELTESEFLSGGPGRPRGEFYDDHNCQFQLALIKSDLLSRYEGGPIYAIRFSAVHFDATQLKYLNGLKNVEQLQFAGCELTNSDLANLPPLLNLKAIGLSDTTVTDGGLKFLSKHPSLNLIETEGTSITADGLFSIGFDAAGQKLP